MWAARARFTAAARRRHIARVAGAAQGGTQLVGELRLEAAEERLERAVGPFVNEAAQAQARDVREAARQHFGPCLDRRALRFAERLQVLLQQPLHAFVGRTLVTPLECAEQRPVVALREAVLQLVERLIHLLACGAGFHEPRGAAAFGVAHDRVHADARYRQLGAERGVDVARHGHVDDQRRLTGFGVGGEPLERRLIQDRRAGPRGREQRFDGGRLVTESFQARVQGAVARRERCGFIGGAVHHREVEARFGERHRGAFRHRRYADERDSPRRARDTLAQMLYGNLGERHAAFRELGAAAYAARDAQRLLEHQP